MSTSRNAPRALVTVLAGGLAILAGAHTAAADKSEEAREILAAAGVRGGLVVHVGSGAGELTRALSAGESYLVLGLDRDPGNVRTCRERLEKAGLSGPVTAVLWRGERLPLADNVVNLLVIEPGQSVSEEEALRVVGPDGVICTRADGRWTTTVKQRPKEIDTWTHYLHDASNNAVAHDARVGPPRHMQWVSDPLWSRNHHTLASVSAIVSDGKRIFSTIDEGPSASMDVPGRWSLIARDAFNGVKLWKRRLASWAHWRHGFRSGPDQLPRTLVAGTEQVYLPLGVSAPLTALDSATGGTVRTYDQTHDLEEVVLDGGVLFVVQGSPTSAQTTLRRKASRGKRTRSRAGKKPTGGAPSDYRRSIVALEAASGKTLWIWAKHKQGAPEVLTLAVGPARVFFQLGGGVVCLDRRSGEELWRSRGAGKGRNVPSIRTAANLVVQDGVVLWASGKTLSAFAAGPGDPLWTGPCGSGFRSPTDVFVAGGLVWTGKNFDQGRDLKTGEVRKTNPGASSIQTAGHHHRCFREKATDRYILCGYRGIEFLDLVRGEHSRNNWVRGVCQYGILPCNGLVYVPPHACGCYMEAKLYGYWSLAARRDSPAKRFDGTRLEKGPAYGDVDGARVTRSDWPTLRHDSDRSGSTPHVLPSILGRHWEARIGGKLSAPTAAGDTVLVSSIDSQRVVALHAESGQIRWTFLSGGRVDSPPTIYQGVSLFGSADGSVYCLRLSDGELVWRFFAAPEDRRTVVRDRVESVWPVHGSVLVSENVAYFSAGRSSYLDGGIVVYGLDPLSGKVLHQATISSEHPREGTIAAEEAAKIPRKKLTQNATDAKTFLAADRSDAFSMGAGTTSDILVSNGSSLFLRHLRFDRKLDRLDTGGRHLFSTSSLLDGAENHRSHWVLGVGDFSRIPVAYSWLVNRKGARANYKGWPAVPFGLILTFDDSTIWGIRRTEKDRGYSLFSMPNRPFEADDDPQPDFRYPVARHELPERWEHAVSMRPRAMVRAADSLVVAGMPHLDPDDPFATFEGRRGGLLWVCSTETGDRSSELELPSPPIWDGVAVAGGRILVTTEDGRVLCVGDKE